MTDRIEKLREKAESYYKDAGISPDDWAYPLLVNGSVQWVTEALTYTDEDVVRAARAMHEQRSAHHWDDMSGWWRQDLIICARAALKSFGARRAE